MPQLKVIRMVIGLVLAVMLTATGCAHKKVDEHHEPSVGAVGMAGAVGTFEFKPADYMEGTLSWWKDSDGIQPGVAGCHIGTDENGRPNGRTFGEACLPDGLLVESNPAAGELHSHKNDIGHPDRFDCNAWCAGQGYSRGACVAAPAPPCAESALCRCQ